MGTFISLEGIEGAGKSTVISSVAEFARSKGKEVVLTRNPGGTRIGHQLRAILLNPEHTEISNMCELMIYTADRAQHVSEVVEPALARGAVVICDRFLHSTVAYQGYGRGLNIETINTLNNLAVGQFKPDMVLLLDLDPEVGLNRARIRAQAATNGDSEWTRFENEKLEFHRKLRFGFLELAKDPANKFTVIDASKDIETVTAAARYAVAKIIS